MYSADWLAMQYPDWLATQFADWLALQYPDWIPSQYDVRLNPGATLVPARIVPLPEAAPRAPQKQEPTPAAPVREDGALLPLRLTTRRGQGKKPASQIARKVVGPKDMPASRVLRLIRSPDMHASAEKSARTRADGASTPHGANSVGCDGP